METMRRMDDGMSAAPMDVNPDHDFAAMMVPHHQGGIDMAKVELIYGADPELRRLAQAIVTDQQNEIELMQLWLSRHPAAPGSPRGGAPSADAAPLSLTKPATPGRPISALDRVYAANQTSNTVSVIDPSGPTGAKLLGEIVLGAPRTEVLSPVYRQQLNVHGLGFSPDHHTLVVVSVGSNSVTFIDTRTNLVEATTYVGRAPHEAFFTPDGKEVWVTVRGQDYVSVIDAKSFKETGRIPVADGPGMVLFRPDGQVAFVVSSFTAELDVVDVRKKAVVARTPVVSPFSPNLAVSADGREMWMTHKDVGKVTRVNAQTFAVEGVLDTGPLTNHVSLVDHEREKLAFVSVGGLNLVKVFTREATPRLIASIPTGALPHGIWVSDDQTRVYVGLENGDAVMAIDVATRRELGRVAIGQAPQALVYVSNAVERAGDAEHLAPLAEEQRPVELVLEGPDKSKASGLVVLRALGLIDTLDINLFGLAPGRDYLVALARGTLRAPIAVVKTNARGAASAQVTGPIRRSLGLAGSLPAAPARLIVSEDRPAAGVLLSASVP